jgi:hypothetical protein
VQDKVELITLAVENKDFFLASLTRELLAKFEVNSVEELPENFSRSKPWSLLNLIDEEKLDIYQLVYINDIFWGSSGGIIRQTTTAETIYQAGFRTFTKTHAVHKGFGTKPYISALCVRNQIERAKNLGCSRVILSFNESNKRLFDLVTSYHHKRTFLGVDEIMRDFVPSTEAVLFNGVYQWLLEMNLK